MRTQASLPRRFRPAPEFDTQPTYRYRPDSKDAPQARASRSVTLTTLGVLLLGLPASGHTVDIYRSVQADGTVVFTDQPDAKATLVTPTVTPAQPQQTAGSASRATSRSSRTDGDNEGDDDSDSARSSAGDRSAAAAPFKPIAPLSTGLPPTSDLTGTTLDEGANSQPQGTASLPAQPSADEDPMAGIPVERVEIASPPPDATVIDPAGPILIEVGTAPGSLASAGLTAEAVVNGEIIASGASTIAVPSLERGTHLLSVRLVDNEGQIIVESETQSLHVRRSFERSSDERSK